MAEALTFVNVVGIAVSAIVVAKWERALDTEKLFAKVGARMPAALTSPRPAE
jgi:Na+/H+-dicarboxylate symporter